ncbi:MAG: tetratricopeptide repeat protein [Elusimicrobiota bacterium]
MKILPREIFSGLIFLASVIFSAPAVCFSETIFYPLEDDLERGNWAKAEGALRAEPGLKSLLLLYQGEYQEALKAWGAVKSVRASDARHSAALGAYLDAMVQIAKGFTEQNRIGVFELRLARRDLVLREGAGSALEACRNGVKVWLGAEPPSPVIVEIYRRKKDFAIASTLGDELLKKSGVIGIAKFARIMLITPEALPFGYAWEDTLCHEYIHHALKSLGGLDFPLWFQEGMARAHETIWRKGDLEISTGDKEELLLAAKDGRLVRFARMEPSMVYLKDEEEISLAFTQVALATRELGPKLGDLIGLTAAGRPFEKAFEKVYGHSLTAFEEKLWAQWLSEAEQSKIRKKSGALRTVLSLESGQEPEKLFLGPKISHLLALGDQLRIKGKSVAALGLYNQAREQEPLNPYVLSRIARAYAASGNREEAAKTAEALIAANPRWPPAYQLQGELFEGLGLYRRAIESYQRYFDFNPYYKGLYKRAAFLHIDLGEPLRALVYLEKALILDPEDQECLQAKDSIKNKTVAP